MKLGFISLLMTILVNPVYSEEPLSVTPNPGQFREDYTFTDNKLDFKIVNKSPKRFKLDRAESSCGCSSITWETNYISPYSEIKGTVVHSPGAKTGVFENKFVMVFKDEENMVSNVALKVSGDTQSLVVAKPNIIDITSATQEIVFSIPIKYVNGVISKITLKNKGFEMLSSGSFYESGEKIISYSLKWKDAAVPVVPPEKFYFDAVSTEGKTFGFYIPVIDRTKKLLVCRNSPHVVDGLERTHSLELKFSGNGQNIKITGLKSAIMNGIDITGKCFLEQKSVDEWIVKVEIESLEKLKSYQEVILEFDTSDRKTVASRVHIISK